MAARNEAANRLKTGLAVGILAAAVVSLLYGAGALRPLELKTYDLRMKSTVPNPPAKPDGPVEPAHPDIFLVNISEESIEWMVDRRGIGWPWAWGEFAQLFDALAFPEFPSTVICFDFFTLMDPDPRGPAEEKKLKDVLPAFSPLYAAVPLFEDPVPRADRRADLEALLKQHAIDFQHDGSIAIPQERVSIKLPRPGIAEKLAGVCDVETKEGSDGITRQYRIVTRFRDRYYPSFVLAALMAREKTRTVRVEKGVLTVGGVSFPVDRDGMLPLRYYTPGRSFRIFAAPNILGGWERLMTTGQATTYDPSEVKGKYVFIGTDAPSLFDLKVTPVSDAMPGVEVHAIALANILNGSLMRPVPPPVAYLVLAALTIALALSTRFTGPIPGGIITVGVLGGYVAVNTALFGALTVVPLVAPLLGGATAYAAASAFNFLYEGRQRRRIKREFQRYVAPQVVEKILKNPDALRMQGERKELSIFFMDFAGFTAMSENLEPQELVRLVSEYHNEAAEEIFRTEGTIDKYIGDAIMAYWNEPIDQPDHAVRACEAALGAQRRLRALAERMRERGLPEMRARIGINTGVATAGDMGAHGQVNYTLIGDEVNLASRLEGVNKEFGSEILISEGTYRPAQERLEVRELATIKVKGRKRPVRIFELLGLKGEVPAERLEAARRFEKALEQFRSRKFNDAWQAFLSAAHQKDPAADVYVAICEQYISEPPPEDWDGSYQMETK